MIKNIMFDLADVIMGSYYDVEAELEQKYNIKPEDFINRKQNQTLDYFFETMRGKHTEDDYLNYLFDGTGWNITVEQFKQLIREKLNCRNEKTIEILKQLKNRYNLILVTDHVKEWIDDIFRNNPDLSIFDSIYCSFSYGKIKQDEGAFQFILDDLKINPEETILVDDSSGNIEFARKAGIECILFTSAEQLEAELKERELI